MIWRRGAFEIEVEWEHGPSVDIIFYGHRTHIFEISYNAYPVLGETMPYTIEDLYRDSPTETPFREMVPWDDPGHDVAADMVEAADNIINDPMNDPALRDKIRAAGREVERRLLTDDPRAAPLDPYGLASDPSDDKP